MYVLHEDLVTDIDSKLDYSQFGEILSVVYFFTHYLTLFPFYKNFKYIASLIQMPNEQLRVFGLWRYLDEETE